MEPKLTLIAGAPDPKAVQPQPAAKPDPAAAVAESKAPDAETAKRAPEAQPPAPDQAETRLVIEMDQASGSYVYKTINRLTGEVMSQLPRAEVLKLRDGGDYAAGTVVRTKA